MNVVRLTYATQMIDEYYKNGEKDSTFLSSFVTALGAGNGRKVFDQVVRFNPQFNEKSTRLDVSFTHELNKGNTKIPGF